jgi:hypothetical protein
MKKLLIILVALLWCNVAVAETMEELLNDKYKITSEELVKGSNWLVTIFVLKKRGAVVTCRVDHFSKTTTCREP